MLRVLIEKWRNVLYGCLEVLPYAAAPPHLSVVLVMVDDTLTDDVVSTDDVSGTSDTPFP